MRSARPTPRLAALRAPRPQRGEGGLYVFGGVWGSVLGSEMGAEVFGSFQRKVTVWKADCSISVAV